MKGKIKYILVLIIILCPYLVFAFGDYLDYITYSMGDLRWCKINGDCTLNSLNVTNFMSINTSLINMNVTSTVNAYGYSINGTSIYSIFCTATNGICPTGTTSTQTIYSVTDLRPSAPFNATTLVKVSDTFNITNILFIVDNGINVTGNVIVSNSNGIYISNVSADVTAIANVEYNLTLATPYTVSANQYLGIIIDGVQGTPDSIVATIYGNKI